MYNTTMNEATIRLISRYARHGDRVVFIPKGETKAKTLWGGLGNRSGLHDYADVLTSQKWEKSGDRLKCKLAKLEPGSGKIKIQSYGNINRDRGRWHTFKTISV